MNKAALTYRIHTIARESGLTFNTVMTYFFMESILSKLVSIDQGSSFVFKGGFLLSNQLGLSKRSTVDIDLLIRNKPLDETSLTEIIEQVCASNQMPEVRCAFRSMEPIRAQDEYGGFRVKILCHFENIRQTIPLDFATGDPVTPEPVRYSYKCLFFDKSIALFSYNVETMLAEKLETIFQLGLANSRSKDFYDIFMMWRTNEQTIDNQVLAQAIRNTFDHRGTPYDRKDIIDLLQEISLDTAMLSRWTSWKNRNTYAVDIAFIDTVNAITDLVSAIEV